MIVFINCSSEIFATEKLLTFESMNPIPSVVIILERYTFILTAEVSLTDGSTYCIFSTNGADV